MYKYVHAVGIQTQESPRTERELGWSIQAEPCAVQYENWTAQRFSLSARRNSFSGPQPRLSSLLPFHLLIPMIHTVIHFSSILVCA